MGAAGKKPEWGVVGHEWALATLAHHILAGRVQHAYLFTGAAAVGKRTLAVAFARALLCEEGNAPCAEANQCRTCTLIAAGKHPDVRMLAPVIGGNIIKTAKIGIEPIRELIRQFSLRPMEAERRVAIITDFDAAGGAAADALLKTLEEPPGNAVIILTAESAADLPPTIVSRCAQLALRPLQRAVVQSALSEFWGCAPEQAEFLARLSGGRLGWAVGLRSDDTALKARAQRLSELRALLPAAHVERFAYADELRKDRGSLVVALDLWRCWWRDVMHVAAGARTPLTNADRSADVRLAAGQLTAAEAARAVASVCAAQARLEHNSNARLTLEVLLLDLPRISVA
ncbi:MAG TPA: DNA polymerase III subunit delta' C-terminal domain-containing protein [Anaerolineales bacterium]|jgi:DNA polymerase-3 subunit delta'|nr:DNA polymerase III subunit delta' C-terminal domain-containing protein [Anaerolineales bacterium]